MCQNNFRNLIFTYGCKTVLDAEGSGSRWFPSCSWSLPDNVISFPDEEGSLPAPPSLSLFGHLEETRAQLEATLGLASLLHAYHLIQVGGGRNSYIVFHLCVSPQAFHEEEGEQFPLTSLTSVVREGNAHHCRCVLSSRLCWPIQLIPRTTGSKVSGSLLEG